MLPYPMATSREEKMEIIGEIKERLLQKYGANILAIGVYGSTGRKTDGPYSDIEMHVVTKNGFSLVEQEFIFEPFKIEISTHQADELIRQAQTVDDGWAIEAGVYVHIQRLYDPENLFEKIKYLPFQAPDSAFYDVMKQFMIWEPYETMGKLRNNYHIQNWNYIPMGARDLVWRTAKLIGLANRKCYSTRARTYEESLQMPSLPAGYKPLAQLVMAGKLDDKHEVYQLCEDLWTGLNAWFQEMGIDYKVKELPI
ncbi:kanamycin nucleotidyltransferase C-terminal domain-containing protein [Virgibacillus sp. 179-BFC.A HS]|uniref:Kanamycin nucleotidyltransferase C-terminal domain-containing protein n=1 Tax=Tigheibacillus jepli TaxID=3035914 RepID=A0ABU5CCW2_9BACI|nr:kanamycin nucleotidyltransferase C-terminal domain-containing protein [Virgibacillus sp. 179-BFC.A HS]MDY0404158.1 kanamycin nucleotidyltransferase C-terminal domain-containing protein [Virgibacillus sp. 179-BFC.A HS]